jgi:hypothetical protein
MSDVAVVAAITGGASVLTAAVTGCVAWTASRNASRVELAKVQADNERLKDSHREDERRNRQSTYHQFIDVSTDLLQILGRTKPQEMRIEICNRYNHLLSGVLVFSPPSVRAGATELNAVYSKIWPALEEKVENEPDKSAEELWRDATLDLKSEFSTRGNELIELMHKDVTRGIAEDPVT